MTSPRVTDLIGDYSVFIRSIAAGLERLGIARSELAMMDHVCYRVETQQRYDELLIEFGAIGTWLSTAVVSGRNIATFEFDDYLVVDDWTVPYLELPEPKADASYPDGLEHAELVVIGGLDRFAARHAELQFDRKGMTKQINPELGLKSTGFAVKFHEQPLGAVVRIEQRLAGNK